MSDEAAGRRGTDGTSSAEAADERFFAALLAADGDELEAILDETFSLIDVVGGSVTGRDEFIAGVRAGIAQFRRIEVGERDVRRWGDVTVIVGRTQMAGAIAGSDFSVASRYTHVLVAADRNWKLVSAQGTQIDESTRTQGDAG